MNGIEKKKKAKKKMGCENKLLRSRHVSGEILSASREEFTE